MATVALTPLALPNAAGFVADSAGSSLTSGAANYGYVAADTSKATSLFFRVSNASGSTANVHVVAGTQPSAISSGLGDVVGAVATATTAWFGPIDSARVQQSDGTTHIYADQAVTVTAFTLEGRRVG